MYDEHISFDKEEKEKTVRSKKNKDLKLKKEKPKEKKKAFFYRLHFDFRSFFKKFGILAIVFFLFILVTTKVNKNADHKILEKNMDIIKNGAYQYFKSNNRPTENDEEYTISLQDLIDDEFVEPFHTKKGVVCDMEQSEVVISKQSETKYQLITHLLCNQEDIQKEYTLTYAKDIENEESDFNKDNRENLETTYYKLKKEESTNHYSYSCPEGYTLSGKKCYSNAKTLTVNPIARYKTISKKVKKASLKKDDDRYIYVKPIKTTISDVYSCSDSATLVGTKCLYTKDYNVTTSCPDPFTKKKDNRCYYTTKADTYWSDWSFISEVETISKRTTSEKNRYDLVDSYRKNGKKYYVYNHFVRFMNYYCKKDKNESVELNGSTCYHYNNMIQNKTCSIGYTLSADGSRCEKYTNASKKKGSIEYSCPTGYKKSGRDENTKCYIQEEVAGYYYCPSEGYHLEGDQCIREASTEFIGYKCPSGYSLNGNQCIRILSGDKISATKTNQPEVKVDYKWSTNSKEAGWTFTGETKKIENFE